ncbi:MAG TPA: aminotransferase class I/II-fold pyridoxal phosphate-dependent enzyme, partial [Stellaceae bacterium]|nr:aminotransferase class I/II-fold pyridoxal phosphate-dependent enzyme [Stellaceae bacterium]
MPHERIESVLLGELRRLETEGRRKGKETVVTRVIPPSGTRGPRFLIEGEGDKPFLRMNSNGYLGLSLRPEIIAAEHDAVRAYGTGPGAVRFISGTWGPHLELERALAAFHGRPAAMLFSSAYATVMGVLPPLITPETAVISDELNHNCIINAIRLARPRERYVYRHLDLAELEARLRDAADTCKRAIIVTDGIFSMRGDHAPLAEIDAIARKHDAAFPENVVLVVDDSHGVGAFGATGRGTEERTGAAADVLIATLGKAFGVNGGYVVASNTAIEFLRETAPLYIYSNPISPGEAAAAIKAVAMVDSPAGVDLLEHLSETARRFRDGLVRLQFETIA